MERPAAKVLRVGAWRVDPTAGQISRDGETSRLEARTMLLLLCLAEHVGEVVSIDDLLNQVWAGVTVTPDSVYQAVASLRRLLGDDPREPTYIATVPRLGYRMVASVGPWEGTLAPTSAGKPPTPADSRSGARRNPAAIWAATAALVLAPVVAFLVREQASSAQRTQSAAAPLHPSKSVAVLPFLDLTQGMKNEEFADGMTEELIDKLSKVPGLRVPSPTSSFYFKNKKVPVADIAKDLGVVYVLDGSVRKSGSRLRVAARLIRADNGYVVWSETYDRPSDHALMVQDDIAAEVTRALSVRIGEGRSSRFRRAAPAFEDASERGPSV
ncbi:MAG TPA: winged helix-turn-helix domain-containing protein [Thermoanaerobaculia bacterium]